MSFNEKVHAYIAAKFYYYLTDAFKYRGKLAFIHATQYYANQRGRRMAQRAIRDGKDLTQATYNYYGEWKSSDEIIQEGLQNKSEKTEEGYMKITQCPWYSQFKQMGADDAGKVYCTYLDTAISAGFNPNLKYRVDQTLNNSNFCIHRLENGSIFEGSEKGKNPNSIKPFEYHCAHMYWSFHEIIVSIFKQQGEMICQKVLQDFIQDYSQEMADIIYTYRDTNFNTID